MYLKKYITILVVTYLGFYQSPLRAEIERRTNQDDIEFFQKLGPWIGLLPGAFIGSGLGMLRVSGASAEILGKTVINHKLGMVSPRDMLKDGIAALLAFNIGLLAGAAQGGVHGAYAGLLLGAGYGIKLDRSINHIIRNKSIIRSSSAVAYKENWDNFTISSDRNL